MRRRSYRGNTHKFETQALGFVLIEGTGHSGLAQLQIHGLALSNGIQT